MRETSRCEVGQFVNHSVNNHALLSLSLSLKHAPRSGSGNHIIFQPPHVGELGDRQAQVAASAEDDQRLGGGQGKTISSSIAIPSASGSGCRSIPPPITPLSRYPAGSGPRRWEGTSIVARRQPNFPHSL